MTSEVKACMWYQSITAIVQ